MTEEDVVVVADPDPSVGERLASLADGRGLEVTFRTVEGANAAERVVDEEPVGCVVCEHRLSDGDGLSLVERLRADDPNLPVVLFTAHGSERVASDAVAAGVTAYVPKGGEEDVWSPDEGDAESPDADAASTTAGEERILDVVADDFTGPGGREARGETVAKIETLHDVAMELEGCTEEDAIYRVAVEAAEQVLEFDMCNIDVMDGEMLVPVQTSSGMPPEGVESVPVDGESVAARVARTGEATYTDDLRTVTDADPTQITYRSGLTVPISDVGIFQAISEELAAFDQEDVELAELLMQHVAESIKRNRFQQTLVAERDRFAALFENVPDPVVRLSATADGPTIEAANVAFAGTFGCDAESVVGETIESILEPASSAGGTDVFPGVNAADDGTPAELRLDAQDGARDFLVHVVPVGSGQASDSGNGSADPREESHKEVYGFYADITETKERERELARQNERLDEFAHVVSHDLRNPLNIAEGHLANYVATADDDSLDAVEEAHERMRELVENLLSLARNGDVVDEPTTVGLEPTAMRAWSSVHLPEGTLEFDDDLTFVADRDRLNDLFANLFRNAGDHASERGTVTVGALEDGDGFYVEDDGPGVPPSEREMVFETGYTTAENGTGFGLAIVNEIATAHGWTVSIEDADSGGARFEFVGVGTPEE